MNVDRRKQLVTEKVVEAIWELLTKLMSILRWSAYIADYRFNELNKQALNAIIAYFLAIEAKEAGHEIDITRFPKIVINRVFEKMFLCDIREDFVENILKDGNIKHERFDEIIEKEIIQLMGEDFARFIQIGRDWEETKIFQGATKIATKMEIEQIRGSIYKREFLRVQSEIGDTLNRYNNFPGFARISLEYSEEMNIFRQISALRNRIRWQKWLGAIPCSVLGHNFEVAIFSYLMALKKYGDEEIATKCFFIGVFHDVPETFTGDMPSPVKDAIPGLRQATEYFELKMMEEHIYSKLPEHLSEAIHMVMMEEYEQEEYKPLIKQADHLSADFECMRQIIAGSREKYFVEVLRRDLEEGKFDELFINVLRKIAKEVL